jgi:Xaa-Pro dipeptidase
MSKEFFEPGEFELRQARVRREMDKQKLDLLLVLSPININYLIGASAKAYQVFQCLFFPRDPALPKTLLLRRSDVAEVTDLSLADEVRGWGGVRAENPIDVFRKILQDGKWRSCRIGVELPAYYLSVGNYLQMKEALAGNEVVDATDLVENLKLAKSPAELAYVRKAAEIADVGIKALTEAMAEGRTEREVAAHAHKAMMEAGGDSPPSPMNFVSGERTCYAHGLPTDRKLQRGDFMHIEFGGQYRRYCSTIARHYSIGKPSKRAAEIHAVTDAACEAAIAVIRPGVPAHKAHQAAGEVIRKAGFGDYFLHTTGYGIAPGYPPSWGESINMLDDNGRVFEAGMVVSIEPPIFIHEERIGARLIDCVIVHETHAEVLSRLPRDLIVIP